MYHSMLVNCHAALLHLRGQVEMASNYQTARGPAQVPQDSTGHVGESTQNQPTGFTITEQLNYHTQLVQGGNLPKTIYLESRAMTLVPNSPSVTYYLLQCP